MVTVGRFASGAQSNFATFGRNHIYAFWKTFDECVGDLICVIAQLAASKAQGAHSSIAPPGTGQHGAPYFLDCRLGSRLSEIPTYKPIS